MSELGYFIAGIKNWYKLDKKTLARVNEMKEIYRQYQWWIYKNDFINENMEDVEYIKQEMNKIYKELY